MFAALAVFWLLNQLFILARRTTASTAAVVVCLYRKRCFAKAPQHQVSAKTIEAIGFLLLTICNLLYPFDDRVQSGPSAARSGRAVCLHNGHTGQSDLSINNIIDTAHNTPKHSHNHCHPSINKVDHRFSPAHKCLQAKRQQKYLLYKQIFSAQLKSLKNTIYLKNY